MKKEYDKKKKLVILYLQQWRYALLEGCVSIW